MPEVLVPLFESPYFHPSFCPVPYETHKTVVELILFAMTPNKSLLEAVVYFRGMLEAIVCFRGLLEAIVYFIHTHWTHYKLDYIFTIQKDDQLSSFQVHT